MICPNGHKMYDDDGEMCDMCKVIFYIYWECGECGWSYKQHLGDNCLCREEES